MSSSLIYTVIAFILKIKVEFVRIKLFKMILFDAKYFTTLS